MHIAKIRGPLVSALWYAGCLLAAPSASSAAGPAADPDDVLLTCQQRVGGAYLAGHVYVLGGDISASAASGWAGARLPVGTTRLVLDEFGFDIHIVDPVHTPASARALGAVITPLSRTDRQIVILAVHPGRMAMVYFFDLASLEFTLSINRWDTPCNNAALLAGRCRRGH